MQAFSVGALVALQRWGRTGRARYAAAAGLLLGLGLCTRLHFAWFWTALAAAGLLWLREASWERLRRPAAAFAAGGILGLAPVIHGEWILDFPGLKRAASMLVLPDSAGTDPHHFLPNLYATLWKFLRMFDGAWWFRNVFADFTGSSFLSVALVVSVGLLAWGLWRRDADAGRRRWSAACLLLTGALLLQAAAVPRQKITHIHLFFLYPFATLLVGAALDDALRRAGGRVPWRTLGRGVVAALLALQVFGTLKLIALIRFQGATELYSDAIYDVARWLGSNRTRPGPVLCLDREQYTTLFFLRPSDRATREVRPVRAPLAFSLAREGMKGWDGPGFYLLLSRDLLGLRVWRAGPQDLREWYASFGRILPIARFYDRAGPCQAEILYVDARRD
jgi:hypothetical protein